MIEGTGKPQIPSNFAVIDVFIPLVIQGFESCLALRIETVLKGAWGVDYPIKLK